MEITSTFVHPTVVIVIIMKIKSLFSNPLISHSIWGFLVGYFVFHPITMVIDDFINYSHSSNTHFYFLSDVLAAFKLKMLPMAILYAFVGGMFGFLYGNYAKLLFEKNEILRRHTQQLKEQILTVDKQATLGIMAGSIGHEIKNILAVIVGYSQLMQLEEDASQKLKSELGKILEATTKLDELAQALLNLGRPRNAKFREINFCEIVDLTTATLRNCGILKRIKVEKEYGDCELIIKADPFLLEQAIRNIVINAAQAMDYKGVLHISIERELTPQFINIKIKDTGPGIPEEYLPQIFDPFFTTKPEGIGNGLGLNIVQKIIKDLGGTIEAQNSKDGSAEFALRLPYILHTVSSHKIN